MTAVGRRRYYCCSDEDCGIAVVVPVEEDAAPVAEVAQAVLYLVVLFDVAVFLHEVVCCVVDHNRLLHK